MISRLKNAHIAIVGGGRFCKSFLDAIFNHAVGNGGPVILGVADINGQAPGLVFADLKGIFTTHDYKDLYQLDGLDLIIELTKDDFLGEAIKRTRPSGVRFIDHFEARAILDYLYIEREKVVIKAKLRDSQGNGEKVENLIEEFWHRILDIAGERNAYSQKIRKDLVSSERAMSQIVQGSTIPTFVINKDHIVTHWNKACEKLTGYTADKIVGTNMHWKPFREKKRPIMADFILDEIREENVWKYYGGKWRKSDLIDGAYEAEEYFPHLGENGTWLFFTAAPIKESDGNTIGAIETLWDKTADKKAEYEKEAHNRELAAKASELAASERALAQIIQGSTVATFVIDKDHIITHWNRALEKLSGFPAHEMVGTNKQGIPFWRKKRHSMADVILDQLGEDEIQKLYGAKWSKSPLIRGAYEAEEFFPTLGENGKWCFFTAAPIKDSDGTITGAIETLWDRTEYKLAEQERDRHYNALAGLCSIYTALNTSLDLSHRINAAIKEILNFLGADGICIFLKEKDGIFHLKYTYGSSERPCKRNDVAGRDSIIYRTAQSGGPIIFENFPEDCPEEAALLSQEDIESIAYIPISTKDRKGFGVIRIDSKNPYHFSNEGINILNLIGNRIGVAIENSLLHEQYIKSEKKYRSLFNNNPNPIFIINSKTLKILDTNQRAQDCYGYSRKEFFRMPFSQLGDANDEELTKGLNNLSKDQSFFMAKKRHFKKGHFPFFININVSYATYGQYDVLIAATTDITESVEKEAQLIQAGKMTTLGLMASGMAHEINQPLNVIQLCSNYFLKMIKKGVPIGSEDLKSLANDISGNVQRAAGIIRHMRDFARQSDVVKNKVNINDPIKDVFKVLGHQLTVHQIDLKLDLIPDIPSIMAEHNRLEQVFINLVTNAIDAMDERDNMEGRKFKKQLTIKSFVENGQVMVSVSDTGTGIPQEVIDKIFEPFFTTKEVGKGTGLGVSISYGIVKDYDGDIKIKSEVGKGTTFELRFPAINEP